MAWQRFGLVGLGLVGAAGAGSAQTAEDERLKALGRHLSRECVSCHRADGVDNGIPAIVGWKVGDFVDTLGFYATGQRANAAMVSIARSLDEEQMRALALWFAEQPKATLSSAPVRRR